MGEGKVTGATVVVPFALTDFAKALRELIGLFHDVAGLANDGIALVKRREAKQKATDLDYLGFPPGGFSRPLTRIAAGRLIPDDFDELDRLRGATAEGVANSVQALRKYRETIRENCGMAIAGRLDQLLDGPDGKFVIRYEIEGLIFMHKDHKPREDIQRQAVVILDMIDRFNADLISLHDTILPPRGAPK